MVTPRRGVDSTSVIDFTRKSTGRSASMAKAKPPSSLQKSE
jgi:hypothetical protein